MIRVSEEQARACLARVVHDAPRAADESCLRGQLVLRLLRGRLGDMGEM